MRSLQFIKCAAVALATLGVVFPQARVMADQRAAAPAAKAPAVLDVALSGSGQLVGRVVDTQGSPLAGAAVVISQNQAEVARVTTDKAGSFTANGLKNGNTTLQVGQAQVACRVWSDKTAPPAAKDGLTIVTGNSPVRGQYGVVEPLDILILGGVIGALVLGGVAVSQNQDIKDDLKKIPKSP